MRLNNRCQLITYPDSFGKTLRELSAAVEEHLQGVIGGIHILPFYPSSADRGFAPLSYYKVDPSFGSWEDIRLLASKYSLTVDFMLNHISRQSDYFQDFLRRKDASPYAELFIRYPRFWPPGRPTTADLEKIYTRKPRPPYTEVEFADGTSEKIWCTFDYEQIDLNLESTATRKLIADFLTFLCDQGASVIRLDAFAYAAKKPGTSCFFVEPEVWEYLEFVREITAPRGVEILPEVHEHYTIQLKLAERGYRVYDFALPMLVLQALYDGNGENLKRWLRACPRRQITTLDTHDGIGVVDVIDVMPPEDLERTKENLYRVGANVKKVYNTGRYNNLDVYQLNCTYYSALGDDDAAYLLARAIQFFTPGIPQVYYVGLLAGRNDIGLLEKTKIGRNINRHNYSLEEVEAEMKRTVVRDLFQLMRLRNSCTAFDGDFTLHTTEAHLLRISWRYSPETEVPATAAAPESATTSTADLRADLRTKQFTIYINGKEEYGNGP